MNIEIENPYNILINITKIHMYDETKNIIYRYNTESRFKINYKNKYGDFQYEFLFSFIEFNLKNSICDLLNDWHIIYADYMSIKCFDDNILISINNADVRGKPIDELKFKLYIV